MKFQIRKLSKGKIVPVVDSSNDFIPAFGTAVFDVDANEFSLEERDVEAMLARSELRSSDLVKFDDVWMSLLDAPPFAEAAIPAAKREARARWAKGTIPFLLLLALYAVRLGLT